MKKSFVIALTLLVTAQMVPAQAGQSTLKVSTYFTATFDNNLKYKGKDCLKVKFKYKGWDGLSYPAQVESIGLYKLNGNDAGGYLTIKIGDTYGLDQGGDPIQGYKTMEICQTTSTQLVDPDCDEEYEASFGGECEYEEVGGTKPGKYYFQASVMQIRPTFLTKESAKVFVTIYK
jgi:hypothetical protein